MNKIIQILSQQDKILGLDDKGELWCRHEEPHGWWWVAMPTEFEA